MGSGWYRYTFDRFFNIYLSHPKCVSKEEFMRVVN